VPACLFIPITFPKNLSQILNIEFEEIASLSDQELDKIPDDGILGGTDYVSGLAWITDGRISMYHNPSNPIPNGWVKGRSFKHAAKTNNVKWSQTSKRTASAQWNDPILREKTMIAMRKPRKQKICPHCKLIGAGGNMSRYHFDNCKVKL
jgi:hypothetical protein